MELDKKEKDRLVTTAIGGSPGASVSLAVAIRTAFTSPKCIVAEGDRRARVAVVGDGGDCFVDRRYVATTHHQQIAGI